MRVNLKVLTVLLLANYGNCANILFLHGMLSPSNHLWLAISGHNITFLSVDPPRNHFQNVHYIFLKGSRENFYEGDDKVDLIEDFKKSTDNKLKAASIIGEYCKKTCIAAYNSENGLNEILAYPHDFK